MNPTAETLLAFAIALGIDPTEFKSHERTDRLHHTFRADAEHIAQLRVEHFRPAIAEYGSAFTVEFKTGDLTEAFIQDEQSLESIEGFAARAAGVYDVVIKVDKNQLLESLELSRFGDLSIRLFLFDQALEGLLAQGPTIIEQELWSDPYRGLLILILDADLLLTGPHLTLAGLTRLSECEPPASPSQAWVDQIFDARDKHIGWDAPFVRRTTPKHLQAYDSEVTSNLQTLLLTQFVKATILYVCDRARTTEKDEPSEIRAEFRGREHVTVIPMHNETLLEDVTNKEAEAVGRVFEWCYATHPAEYVADRLPFVQTRVAATLGSLPAADRFRAFATSMPYLFEGLEWHWKSFIEGKVTYYFDRVREIENLVSDTVEQFRGKTQDAVKALSDTMLAALAVAIGTFLAASFRDPFNASLFRIGMLAYAGYVIVFPGFLGILSNFRSFNAVKEEFEIRRERFSEILTPDRVREIVGKRVDKARNSYWIWLWIIAAIYVGVVALSGFAADRVPPLVAKDASLSPNGTPVVSISPDP